MFESTILHILVDNKKVFDDLFEVCPTRLIGKIFNKGDEFNDHLYRVVNIVGEHASPGDFLEIWVDCEPVYPSLSPEDVVNIFVEDYGYFFGYKNAHQINCVQDSYVSLNIQFIGYKYDYDSNIVAIARQI